VLIASRALVRIPSTNPFLNRLAWEDRTSSPLIARLALVMRTGGTGLASFETRLLGAIDDGCFVNVV